LVGWSVGQSVSQSASKFLSHYVNQWVFDYRHVHHYRQPATISSPVQMHSWQQDHSTITMELAMCT